jgi:hypothetical protein
MDTTLLRTIDGGQSWLNCEVDVYGNPYLRSVQFIDELKGWAVGTGGAILMSDDGGITWQEIHTGFSDLLQSVCFTDPLNGWASGTDGNILRTIDGGYTWFKQYSGMNRYITSICFVDPLNGWIAGEGGAIKRTTNGGFWTEPGVFHRNGMNKPVLDNQDTKDTITVNVLQFRENGYELAGVEVMLDSIIHPNVSSLSIMLSHDGAAVTVAHYVAADGPDFLWTRLKDEAETLITEGKPPFSGNYKPYNSLSYFNHLNPDGEWVLTIHDSEGGNTGVLKAWGIKPLFEKPVGINDPDPAERTDQITLLQNMPNPFTRATRISWTSGQAGRTLLKLYDNQGRAMQTLLDEYKPEGEHSVDFDGSHYSPGVYYYRLQVGDIKVGKKCIIE